MQTDKTRNLKIPPRGSALRTFMILGTLMPAWHSIGTDIFHSPGNEAIAATAPIPKCAIVPYPSSPMDFKATAYCDSGVTKSGVMTEYGIVAADPSVLPLGSWIHVDGAAHRGLFRVMDTGRLIKGKMIDIYLPSLKQAIDFGRQSVQVTVVRYGPARRPQLIFE